MFVYRLITCSFCFSFSWNVHKKSRSAWVMRTINFHSGKLKDQEFSNYLKKKSIEITWWNINFDELTSSIRCKVHTTSTEIIVKMTSKELQFIRCRQNLQFIRRQQEVQFIRLRQKSQFIRRRQKLQLIRRRQELHLTTSSKIAVYTTIYLSHL